jgi:TPR repeat protein
LSCLSGNNPARVQRQFIDLSDLLAPHSPGTGGIMKKVFASIALFWCFAPAEMASGASQELVNDSLHCLSVDFYRSNLQSQTIDTNQLMEGGTATAYSENRRGIAAIIGSPHDLKEAYRWFQKAARRGYAPAQVNLAMMYLQGWGVARNDGAALYWLTLAAQQRHPVGLFDLGQLYLKGCGVPQDYAEALRLFQEAARKGYAAAEVNIGYMYDAGLGVPRDRAVAAEWYRKAAEVGEPAGEFNLGELYRQGEGVAQSDRIAFEWFQKAAEQGHRKAQAMMGFMYAAGRGTPKDLESAYAWIGAARSEGELDLQDSLLLAEIERQLPIDAIQRAKERVRLLAQPSK